ncbi:MAG TPA: cysteine desulfurase family protein [bacterium]
MDLQNYLDNAATTPVFPEVLEASLPYLRDQFGNPSSIHSLGMDVRRAVKLARERLARVLGLPPQAVIFTAGGTEADNLALLGTFESARLKGDRLLVSAIEHPAVLNAAEALQKRGVRVDHIPVTRQGVADLAALERLLGPDVRMVSVMAMNNELGTAQPLVEIGKLIECVSPKTVFHVDAVQAFTKQALPWREARIDLISVSAHKVHGPKGTGALFHCTPVPLEPVTFGGGQEDGFRSGTENPFGMIALSFAAEQSAALHRRQAEERRAYHQRWLSVMQRHPRLRVFRSERETPFVIQFSVPPIPAEVVLNHLQEQGVFVSTGSACHTHNPEPSHVLLAAGIPAEEAVCSVRMSFSVHNTLAGQDPVIAGFERAIARVEKL